MSEFFFKKTLIIGLGLIGGSFAKSLKKNKLSQEIYACDLDEEIILKAQKQGIIKAGANIENDISSFDFIVIATPLSSYKNIFSKIRLTVSKKTIIIDLGSLKSFIKGILPVELRENFIGCHPIAGLETSGFEASDADLFVDKKFIICDSPFSRHPWPERPRISGVSTDKTLEILDAYGVKDDWRERGVKDGGYWKVVEDLVKRMGCEPDFIDAKTHDEIYALVSHLPQFLSFLTKEFLEKNIEDEFFKKAFRLDKSSPEIWEDIFKLNQKNLEKFYLEFFDNLVDAIEGLDEFDLPPTHYVRRLPLKGEVIERVPNHSPLKGESTNVVSRWGVNFLEENFAPIFFRLLIVSSYLKIKKINDYKSFAGSGFKDFTLIIELLKYDREKLLGLLKKNQRKIIEIFESIS